MGLGSGHRFRGGGKGGVVGGSWWEYSREDGWVISVWIDGGVAR